MGFIGFGLQATAFFAGLEADNSKAYWTRQAAVYESDVRGPMKALIEAVDPQYQPLTIFRPYRDVRFAKDKTPYKTHTGAVGELEGGSIVYVQLSAKGLMAACGYYSMASDQLERYRLAVADDHLGPKLEKAIAEVRKAKAVVSHGMGEPLKTAPRGYPRDHPRIALLQWKGVIGAVDFGAPSWITGSSVVSRVEKAWAATKPIQTWMDSHVGPSRLMPDEFR
jgi:uncharacterized protein (TIGR02453 family)